MGVSSVSFFLEGIRGKPADHIIDDSGSNRTLIGIVSANTISNLYDQYKDRLLTLNIRNFVGNTRTNKGIRHTLAMEPQHFLSFNNGISCVCQSFTIAEGKKIEAQKFQIINGAQTLRCIGKARSQDTNMEDAHVLIRLTEVPDIYKAPGNTFLANVIRFNNTQNIVKVSDFRTNDPIQKSLQKKFGALPKIGGKEVFYQVKRTDRKPRRPHLIKLEEFTKVIYSFLYNPVDFSQRSTFLFDESEDGGYVNIFGDGTKAWDSMDEENFKLYSSIWFCSRLFIELRKEAKNTKQDPIALAALERKWFLLYAFRLWLDRVYGKERYASDLSTFYKGEWLQKSCRKNEVIQEYFDRSCDTIVFAYKQARENDPELNYRNWTRSEKTIRDINTLVSSGPWGMPPRLR